ncbi:MAG: PKD domain-containing protein [Methanoregulaceae archaeon]|jgi:hypothetical protein
MIINQITINRTVVLAGIILFGIACIYPCSAADYTVVSRQIHSVQSAQTNQMLVTVTSDPATYTPGSSCTIQVVVTLNQNPYPTSIPVQISASDSRITITPHSRGTDSSGSFYATLTTISSTSGVIHVQAQASDLYCGGVSAAPNQQCTVTSAEGSVDIPQQEQAKLQERVIYVSTTPTPVAYQPPVNQPQENQPAVQPIVYQPQVNQPPVYQPQQQAVNQPPVAVISVDKYAGNAGLTINFDARKSYAPGGSIRTYTWNFGDGSSGNGYVAQHQYSTPGTYTASLVVTDNNELSSTPATTQITVWSPIAAPVNNGGDRHFTMNESEGKIEFNNGTYGQTPPQDQNIYANNYRTGDSGSFNQILENNFIETPVFSMINNGFKNSSYYLSFLLNNNPIPPPVSTTYNTTGRATQTYRIGVNGLSFQQDAMGVKMLRINYTIAHEAGAIILFHDTYVIVYHHSAGVLLTFIGEHFTSNGGEIYGKVTRATFLTDHLETTTTYGVVDGAIGAEMFSLPKDAEVTTTILEIVTVDLTNRFNSAAERNNLKFDSIAFTFDVQKKNFTTTGAANVSLSVPVSWVKQHGGRDVVWIARINHETGLSEIVQTFYVGLDQKGNMVFRGDSPNGTSIFGIITAKATTAKQQAEPSVTIPPSTQPALLVDIGMFVYLWSVILKNPIVIVIVITIVGLVAYFQRWKRQIRYK